MSERDFEYIDADGNWCPDCGEPRGICRCAEYRAADEALYDDDNNSTHICWVCGQPMEWTSEYREIELEGGFMGIVYEPIYECTNPDCNGDEDEDD